MSNIPPIEPEILSTETSLSSDETPTSSVETVAAVAEPEMPSPTIAAAHPERTPAAPLKDELLRIAVLVVIAVGLWCWLMGRFTPAAWNVPLEYGMKGADGDAMGFLAHIKGAQEGEFGILAPRNVSRLAAPYYAAVSDVPVTEGWQLYLPGVLARFIGLFAAANFAIMLSQVLACVCFYIVARWLDCKWWWAFAGAFVFGFSQFAFARSLHHINVTNYWHIPLCLLIAGWITRNEMGELRSRRYLFSLIASFFIGMQNPYYTGMFLQLALLGAFYQYFRVGWTPVRQACGFVAASACGAVFMQLNSLFYHLTHGPNHGAIVREFKWLEFSALKFVDLLIPPQNHPLLGRIGLAYYGSPGREYDMSFPKMVAFPSEVPPSCYLGILGIAALVWLTVISVRRLVVENERGRNLPLEAWQVLWILAFSCVGGINCLLGIIGITVFRSTTRYSIFILPILLLFALKRISRIRLDPEMGMCAAGFCALLALWDQTPPITTAAKLAEDARVVDSDRQFTREIEARLPAAAMVFQIPIMENPESPAPGMPSYDHFRPYIHSSKLRFSFGGIKGRPWLNWQKELSQQSFPDVIRNIEAFGFAAVYVNRNGFMDRAEGILKEFHRLGYNEVIESTMGDLFCVPIHPSLHPVLPAGPVK